MILKQGEALLLLLFNFALDCVIRSVQVNQGGLKLDVQHELLVYADDVNILRGSIHAVKKNTDGLVVSNEETGLEVNDERTKYMVMSGDQKARQNHNIKTINNFFEKV
jgi:Ribonuclease G/E